MQLQSVQVDLTRIAVVLSLSVVAGVLVHLGKDAPTVCAILVGIITAANGFLRSPTQTPPSS